jgi:nicotinate-nucleotide adenylyltransferase
VDLPGIIKPMSKVGIFSGTFDPIHSGHIAFALQAIEVAGLDMVYFLPEALPRRKNGVTHYAHRIKMLELALRPYQKLAYLEMPDKRFSVNSTMPRLRRRFEGDDMYMLMGSDMLELLDQPAGLDQWPGLEIFLANFKLIVGVRNQHQIQEVKHSLKRIQPGGYMVVSKKPSVSSSHIRKLLMSGQVSNDVLTSIMNYIDKNWLYVSVEPNNS